MRILLVSHYALPHQGGIEVLVDTLARELTARGHRVVHVASAAGREGAQSPSGYILRQIPALNVTEERLAVPFPLFGTALLRVLREEVARADVVHAHGFLYATTVAALALAGRGMGPRRILTEHVGHVQYRSRLVNGAEALGITTVGRWSLKRADAVVVFNETVRSLVERLAPGTRAVWIENGVDTDLFRPPEAGERERLRAELGWDARPRVLFVGRPVEKKGFPLALAALAVSGDRFVLAVAGQARGVGPPEGVEWLGVLDRQRMAAVYRAADALVMPSHGEGLPLSIQESLASGLRVVASDDPGYRKSLRGAESAVTLVSPTVRDLGDALDAALRLPPPPDLAAVAFARERFSLARWADQHESLYSRLTG